MIVASRFIVYDSNFNRISTSDLFCEKIVISRPKTVSVHYVEDGSTVSDNVVDEQKTITVDFTFVGEVGIEQYTRLLRGYNNNELFIIQTGDEAFVDFVLSDFPNIEAVEAYTAISTQAVFSEFREVATSYEVLPPRVLKADKKSAASTKKSGIKQPKKTEAPTSAALELVTGLLGL